MSQRDHGNTISFTITGKGKELANLKNYAREHKLPVDFSGYVTEAVKADIFKKAALYVFASKHEGMPISLLEAMAFGLPVLITRVGGIHDFFEEGKMGYFLDRCDPAFISEKVYYLIERPELMNRIAEYNYQYAKKHFYASNVTKRLEEIITACNSGSYLSEASSGHGGRQD